MHVDQVTETTVKTEGDSVVIEVIAGVTAKQAQFIIKIRTNKDDSVNATATLTRLDQYSLTSNCVHTLILGSNPIVSFPCNTSVKYAQILYSHTARTQKLSGPR